MGSGRQSDLGDRDDLRALRERVDQLERLNAQLVDSEERLQILFEHAPDGYYLSDLKGTLVDGNAAAERITGYKKEELIGKSLLKLKLLSAGDVLRAASLLARNVLGKSTGPDEFTLIRKDGAAIAVEISTRPVRIGNRRVVLGIARDITERKRMEHQLRERTKELQALYGLAEIAERDDVSLDELYQELTDTLPKGWQYEDITCARIRIGDREFRTGNFAESRWKQSAPVKVSGAVIGTIDVSYLDERPDEDEGPFLKEERRLIDALAQRLGQITERKRAEEELRLSEARLEEAQRTARVGSWETNLVTAQVVWSDELCRLFEIAPETIREGRDQVQAALVERIHPDDRARYEEAIAQSIQQNARYDIEYRIRWSDGSQRYLHSQGGPALDPGGNVVRLSGTVTDITERKQLEEQLARMARHDPLTGVLNRYALEELLEREASRSERYAHPIGFLMIDVNRFKEINDRFGHAMGDKVLQAIAAVIQHNIRDADILVRYGGDEFLVILPETNGETDVVKERILAEVARRNQANPLLDFPVTLAIGSAHWSSSSGQTMEQILAETDKLMYEDKRRSSGTA
jgi:diguanylate cyclase (GGDEF)-like protein/PAS domain S-box-containing protein